jgi:hypothetical protein
MRGGDAHATATWKRNDSCRTAVRANFGRQFVAADAVLAALLDNAAAGEYLLPVAVDFAVTPYPPTSRVPAPPPASHKLWKYVGVPWDLVQALLARVRWF